MTNYLHVFTNFIEIWSGNIDIYAKKVYFIMTFMSKSDSVQLINNNLTITDTFYGVPKHIIWANPCFLHQNYNF